MSRKVPRISNSRSASMLASVKRRRGFNGGRRFDRHFVGNTRFETAYSEAMGTPGIGSEMP